MITCKLALSAETVIVDAASQVPSAIGIMDELSVIGFPAVVPSLTGLFLLRREQGDPQQLHIVLRATLNGVSLGQFPITLDFQDKTLTRAIARIQGLVLSGPGTLRVSALLGDTELGGYDSAVVGPNATVHP